jgi:hypothetical protein
MARHRAEDGAELAERLAANARRFFGRPVAPPPAVR